MWPCSKIRFLLIKYKYLSFTFFSYAGIGVGKPDKVLDDESEQNINESLTTTI